MEKNGPSRLTEVVESEKGVSSLRSLFFSEVFFQKRVSFICFGLSKSCCKPRTYRDFNDTKSAMMTLCEMYEQTIKLNAPHMNQVSDSNAE